jgi:SAM-dependent methyltransferase
VSEAIRQAFLARVAYDLGAAHSAALVVVGDRLGLYRALAEGPLTPSGLAGRTGTHERYVREWLHNQAAGGYVEHDPAADTYTLGAEQVQVLATEGGAAFAVPAFQLAVGLAAAVDAVTEAFRSGDGLRTGAYGPGVRDAIARGSRALCQADLVSRWLPPDVAGRLAEGGTGTDVGCGTGGLVRALAEAFPRSQFRGIDVDEPALARARREANVLGGRVRFEAVTAASLDGAPVDLLTCIDALHEMPDPAAVAGRLRAQLKPDGCALVVEPCTDWSSGPDSLARLLAAISTLYCVPVGRSGGGEGQGALRGESWLLELLAAAGFSRLRAVRRLPLHVVIEARP